MDSDGHAYVSGATDSIDFPTVNAIQPASAGGTDSFVAKLSPNGSAFDYCTYLGGSGDESGAAIAVDLEGNAYVAGGSQSENAPATSGALQFDNAGRADALIAKIVDVMPELAPVTTVSAASFSGNLGVAPGSIASGFGDSLAPGTAVADTVPLPTSLLGTLVRITDREGKNHLASLFFVSPGQINYLVPEAAATGLAQVTVTSDGQDVASGSLQINAAAPSLFSANATGQGVAAASFLRVAADGSRAQDLIFNPNTRVSVPIDLGPEGDQVFLLLFGTGVRGFTSQVTAIVGGESVPVLGAVPQGEFVGLDQINIGPLPSSPWQKCPFSVGLIRASEEGQPPDSQGRRAQGASEAIPTLS